MSELPDEAYHGTSLGDGALAHSRLVAIQAFGMEVIDVVLKTPFGV